jgi:predicted dehydrogenase
VSIGVVGAGLVAQVVHLPLLQRLDRCFRLTALAEPAPEIRAAVGARHAIGRLYADHRALLDAGGIDAVLVCSPNATHAQVVVDALEAGVHVLVEKPLCTSVAEATWIIDVRDRARLVVQVGYMKRFDPAVEALLDELPADWLPTHIATATFDPGMREAFGLAGAPTTLSREDAFLGALVHDVNLVNAVLARCGATVDRVVDAWGDEDGTRATATIALAGEARWTAVWMALPGAGTFREHVALYGRDGVRELEFPAPYALHQPTIYRRTSADRAGAVTTTRSSWHEAYERQLRHFHQAVTAGAQCRTPAEEGLADIRLLTELLAIEAVG